MTIVNPLAYTIQNGQAVDAVPVMANLNQIVSNVNANAAAVAGNAAQTFAVADATAANQAVALGQFSQRPFYSSSNTTTVNVAANTTVPLLSIAVTTPSFSKTGGFRMFVVGQILVWPSGGSPSQQSLTFSLNDGTNKFTIGFLNAGSTPYNGCMVVGKTSVVYAPGQNLTFSLNVTAGGASVTVPMQVPIFYLLIEEA